MIFHNEYFKTFGYMNEIILLLPNYFAALFLGASMVVPAWFLLILSWWPCASWTNGPETLFPTLKPIVSTASLHRLSGETRLFFRALKAPDLSFSLNWSHLILKHVLDLTCLPWSFSYFKYYWTSTGMKSGEIFERLLCTGSHSTSCFCVCYWI